MASVKVLKVNMNKKTFDELVKWIEKIDSKMVLEMIIEELEDKGKKATERNVKIVWFEVGGHFGDTIEEIVKYNPEIK